MTTTSTLVETVSIDYEDFTEGFLTCGTCLNTYDAGQHAPKLLTCSHTLCKMCLESICSQPGVPEIGSFRCPICRELIHLPREGVINFPPSFLVNQLLDLVNRQRREVIPKCSSHVTQELLFCETCDIVFCLLCNNGSHSTINCKHTVIPFAVAIKRMSEILMYKAHQCIAKYNEAHENVTTEIHKLDQNAEQAFEDINRTFQEIINLVERRRQDVLSIAKKMKQDKVNILENQLRLIEGEKAKIEAECDDYSHQVDLRNITKKIEELNEKIDSINGLLEPRENCFIRYEHLHNSAVNSIQTAVNSFGTVRSSKTFPPLCEANIGKCVAKLRTSANIITYDYAGSRQRFGGDPVTAELRCLTDESNVPVKIVDKNDGTYEAQFIAPKGGKYCLLVSIFGRPIKTYPLEFEATLQINPICIYGSRGNEQHAFLQPVAIAISETNDQIYVLDTGNCRVKILSQNDCNNSPFTCVSHIDGLDRSVTGMALVPESGTILVSNWSTRTISELTDTGKVLRYFSHRDLREPTHLCVNSQREIIVADNGAQAVFIFHPCGKVNRRLVNSANGTSKAGGMSNVGSGIGNSKGFGVIGAITMGPDDEIIVAESRIKIYSKDGSTLLREIASDSWGKGDTYGGLCYDKKGHLLATKSERGKVYVQVYDYYSGHLKLTIDSMDAKLKRASGLATTNDYHVIVVDLGNDCIKKYRYH